MVVLEDEHKNLMLANGLVVQAQGYAQFILQCGDFKCPIIAKVFPNITAGVNLGDALVDSREPHY